MPIFNNTPDTEPLSKEEKAWIRKLERVLISTPRRFGISTIGDNDLSIYDKDEMIARGIEEEECNDSANNLDLARVKCSTAIQGWCG